MISLKANNDNYQKEKNNMDNIKSTNWLLACSRHGPADAHHQVQQNSTTEAGS